MIAQTLSQNNTQLKGWKEPQEIINSNHVLLELQQLRAMSTALGSLFQAHGPVVKNLFHAHFFLTPTVPLGPCSCHQGVQLSTSSHEELQAAVNHLLSLLCSGLRIQGTSAISHSPSPSSEPSFGCSILVLSPSYTVAPRTACSSQGKAAPVRTEWDNHFPWRGM